MTGHGLGIFFAQPLKSPLSRFLGIDPLWVTESLGFEVVKPPKLLVTLTRFITRNLGCTFPT